MEIEKINKKCTYKVEEWAPKVKKWWGHLPADCPFCNSILTVFARYYDSNIMKCPKHGYLLMSSFTPSSLIVGKIKEESLVCEEITPNEFASNEYGLLAEETFVRSITNEDKDDIVKVTFVSNDGKYETSCFRSVNHPFKLDYDKAESKQPVKIVETVKENKSMQVRTFLKGRVNP